MMKKLLLAALVGFFFSSTGHAVDINAGPIWNNGDAQQKCPNVCKSQNMNWNGNWTTTIPGQMSVCGCNPKQSKDIEAGPIWSNADAQTKCPNVCSAQKMTWNGNWVTTIPGQMSVCNCTN